ncbi:cytochrome c1-2, heme protein, mitochondrial [Tanacetum coccineum]
MGMISYRDLVGVAYTEEETKAMAVEIKVVDGHNDEVNAALQVVNAWVFILLEALFGNTVLDTLGMKEPTYA